MPPIDPNQLAQDKEFSAAAPEDQIKYLSAQDPDFAKASPEDQRGYLAHLTGKSVAPNTGLAPPAGAPPKPAEVAKTMTSGEGPIAQGMTSMENRLGENAMGMGRLIKSSWMDKPKPDQPTAADQFLSPRNLNPIVTSEGSLPRNIGATAANVLPMLIDPEGGGIGNSAAGRMVSGVNRMIPSAARAGRTLEGVTTAMRGVPVNAGPMDSAAAEALLQHEHGAGALPPPIKKYIQYAGGPGGMRSFPGSTNIPFEDARDFQSNSGRLSSKATRAMSPKMKAQLANFAAATSDANQSAAQAAGQGEPYSQGMNEYRRAMKMRDAGRAVGKTVGRAVIPTVLGYEGYRMLRDLKNRP